MGFKQQMKLVMEFQACIIRAALVSSVGTALYAETSLLPGTTETAHLHYFEYCHGDA